ncbi:MAG: TonB-dependent receptor [Prevotella sp.]|nr:TonB-dependent receptor [Prevotella sp.]
MLLNNSTWKPAILAALLNLLPFAPLPAQDGRLFTVSGMVKDANTNETLTGVPVGVKELPRKGTATNEHGFYSITLPQGKYTLQLSYLGYEPAEIAISLTKNLSQPVLLKPSAIGLDEVVVINRKSDENISGVQTGVEKIGLQEIQKLPVLMGERDLIKTIQLLPGVKSTGEGSTGMYVRGGSADQNAILLDNAPLYNASHLMGFFSTFNSDAVKDATLYKGAMPAQFGERLASTLEVQMRDGDSRNYRLGGGVGLISSNLSVEGPISQDKASFLLSGRRTYADVLARMSGVEDAQNATLYFYDLNLKLNWLVSDRDKLFFSGYMGNDNMSVKEVISTDWGNTTAALRWNRILHPKWFLNSSLIYNRYGYNMDVEMGMDVQISGQIDDYIWKQELQYFHSPNSVWRLGYSTTYHDIAPGKLDGDTALWNRLTMQHRYSWENGIYASNTLKLSDKLEVMYGLRLSTFSVLGKGDFYTLNERYEIIDTTSYRSGEFVKTYLNREPRLSAVYKLNAVSSLKAAYGRTTQNMHLVSYAMMMGLMDRWTSSTNIIKPQIADQITLGYFRNFADNEYEFSMEGYYKDMRNQIDFKDHANVYGVEGVETELRFGKGRAYGIEWLLRKKTGKLTGWLGYTLARSEKKIDGVNNNRWYPAMQDRTHDVSIVGIYELNKKWTLSATWVYYTGNAITYPSGKVVYDGQEYPYYHERNGYRAPSYHRLDLGATCILKQRKNYYSELSFSLYNAYGRENPYVIYFDVKKDDPTQITAYQYSLFRFVPSISWNFKFR